MYASYLHGIDGPFDDVHHDCTHVRSNNESNAVDTQKIETPSSLSLSFTLGLTQNSRNRSQGLGQRCTTHSRLLDLRTAHSHSVQ